MTNDSKIIQFPNKKQDRQDMIVKILERELENAKAGKIAFLAMAAVDENGIGYSAWGPEDFDQAGLTSAIGAVTFLQARFVEGVVSTARYPKEDEDEGEDEGA